jgi:hypothetical protein
MPADHARLRQLAFVAAFAAATVAGCAGGGGIEGKYYNSRSGEFAMELKGGRAPPSSWPSASNPTAH